LHQRTLTAKQGAMAQASEARAYTAQAGGMSTKYQMGKIKISHY